MAQLTDVKHYHCHAAGPRGAWLYCAQHLVQLPLGVIGVAIGVVLLPALSHKLRSGDHAAVLAGENRALEFALLLTMPATVALVITAEPVMHVLFERGDLHRHRY